MNGHQLAFLGFFFAVFPTLRAEPRQYLPLPEGVSSLGAAVCDGWLYVYGGHTGKPHRYSTDTVSGKFHRLNLKDPKRWEELPSGPPLQGMNLVAYKGKVYRIGGMQPRNKPGEEADTHSVADCSCYDPAAGKWTASAPLPEPRSSHDVVVVGDKLYAVGGWRLSGRGESPRWHSTALVLDLAAKEKKWLPIKQPFQRRALTAAAVAGKIYVLGGFTPNAGPTRRVEVFEPETRKWTTVADLPGPDRNGFSPAACEASGRLYLNAADGFIQRLDEKGTGWENIGSIGKGRIVARLVPAGKTRLLVVGGSSGRVNASELGLVELKAEKGHLK